MARPRGVTILHLKCETCGADVERRKGQEREHTFCSRECYWKSDRLRSTAKQAWHRHVPRITEVE